MHSASRSVSWLLSCLSIVSLISIREVRSQGEIDLSRCRTEGRLTLTYDQSDRTSVHELAFSESMNTIARKSAISIGYVSHTSDKYYTFGDGPTITVNPDGVCGKLDKDTALVPAISWLVDLMLPGVDLQKYKKSGETKFVGATGLLQIFHWILDSSDRTSIRVEPATRVTHRNVLCHLHSQTFQLLGNDSFEIQIEIFEPVKGVVIRNLEETYFTFKAKTIFKDSRATVNNAGFMIEFFNIELADDQTKLERLNEDFNIPLGKGCSEFLAQIEPEVKSYSFSMGYTQLSSLTPNLMAYDHLAGFLRKEQVGVSVSIWDLKEDLLYHIDKNVSRLIGSNQEITQEMSPCSLMEVDDPKLGPAYHPYEKESESLEVLQLIGATRLAYMGLGSVRDLPCYIYETILTEPPVIFGLTEEQLMRNSALERDYIVQYYLLRGDTKPDLELRDDAFFPAKIVLLRRTKTSGAVEFIDQLDIYEFFWSLDGWNKKGVELFMASECFDDEVQQLKLELAIVFDRVHGDLANEDDKTLLAYNKFKLEFDLINNILDLLAVRRTHLIQYELKLRPNHVNLDLVIADRSLSKDLRYFGPGRLASASSYSANRVSLANLSEESCISVSSLIVDISLVVYCPRRATAAAGDTSAGSSCIAVYGENEPTVESYINTDANTPNCQVYRFNYGQLPHQATYRLTMNKNQLHDHQVEFVAKLPWAAKKGSSDSEILKGSIKDYEITHQVQLLTVDNYSFAADFTDDSERPGVRSFESISYDNIGDCIRVCNLDVTCKSYSFCSGNNGAQQNQCLLSTLDIRSSKILDQLVHAPSPSSDNDQDERLVTVVGDRGKKYRLRYQDRCDIYERDYLSLFRQTDEIIRLPQSIVHQFQTAPSTFECAKQSVDLELSFDNHHVAMFAYCGSNSLCILDESLFAPNSNATTASNDGKDHEILCNVYRKKYQTYFDVSGKVLKQSVHQDQQVEFEFNTVEECARACWNQFGQVCGSFDFCSPGSCLINRLSAWPDGIQLESKSGCLHYERDLKWDELRKEHLIGRHAILEQPKSGSKSDFFWSLVTLLLVACSFVYGLVVGRQVNDKLESVTVLMQSISYGRGARGSARFFTSSRSAMDDESGDAPGDSILDASDEVSSTTNAIRMDVIRRNRDEHDSMY